MQICVDHNPSQYQIQRFEPPLIWINQTVYQQSLIIMPDQLIPHWRPLHFEDLSLSDLSPLLELGLEIVLIGAGRQSRFASAQLNHLFFSKGIGLEVMTTAAAVKTYAVLSSEQRKVAAALILE